MGDDEAFDGTHSAQDLVDLYRDFGPGTDMRPLGKANPTDALLALLRSVAVERRRHGKEEVTELMGYGREVIDRVRALSQEEKRKGDFYLPSTTHSRFFTE